MTSWGLRGQKRGDNKHCNTRPGIPAEKEKHKLMTTIMSNVPAVVSVGLEVFSHTFILT